MRGKWAEGIEPRHFNWILKDQFAICERPGGYGLNHRPVRRLEEILWIRQRGFDVVISLIPSPHNLHNYSEEGVTALHRPFNGTTDLASQLEVVYTEVAELRGQGKKLLVHHDELGERVCGFAAGYLVWSGLLDSSPRAITVIEQITARQLGPTGRAIVTVAEGLPRAPVVEADGAASSESSAG
jgi:hypothetical protein